MPVIDNRNSFMQGDVDGGSISVETPQSYADYSEYDSVTLNIVYKTPYAGLYLTPELPITKNNLVGSEGTFSVVVNCICKNAAGSDYTLVEKEEYSIDEWIEKATGNHFVNGEWTSGGTSANGFEAEFDDGSEAGSLDIGEFIMKFSLTAKVADGYVSASADISVPVFASFYEDDGVYSLELRPVYVGSDLFAWIGGDKVQIAKRKDYCLVDSSLSDNDVSGIGEYDAAGIVLTTKVNPANGDVHFYLDDIEIFGLFLNVYESYEHLPRIPENGKVVLFQDFIPPVDGESNIEVLYPCYVEGNSDKIDKCTIAKLFGNANSKNRLFVSGNPDYFNCDWHSSAFNAYLEDKKEADSNGDFTYFGDMDYCFYGQTDNAIMGYDNVATDKMIVLKSKSKVEPTNYFRTSSLIQAIDASGNAVNGIDGSALYAESFPLATGNIGAGAMNHNSIVNLNGDTLYLSSENTICGLNIAGQVGDSQRISYSRSRFIDPELKELNLSDAVLWTDNTDVYLFASEATYVANYETFNSETAQYEWFKMDVKGVRCAIEIDGVIWFGTESGAIYQYEKNRFSDCDKIFLSVGATLYSEDKITYNSELNDRLGDGSDLTFKIKPSAIESALFRKVATIVHNSSSNADLSVNQTSLEIKIVALGASGHRDYDRYGVLVEEMAFDGYVYFDSISGSSALEPYTPYKIVPTIAAEHRYRITDADGVPIDISGLESAVLCHVLDGEYKVTDLDKENCTFKIRENGRVIDIWLYDSQNMLSLSFPSEIHIHRNVKAFFIAAPAVLGDISYRKTVWAWTLSAFKETNDLQVCQATNEETLEDMRAMAFADNVPIGLDFKDFSFSLVDFGKSAVPRKFTYFRPLSVPFMAFGFKSDNDANSILTATSIVYTVPMLGRGNK